MKKFGVLLVQDRPAGEILDWAQRFDEAGVDSLWVSDHLVHPAGIDSFWLDGWSLLAAIAGRSRQSRLGLLVTSFVLHPPMRMARLTVTLDGLSGGRFDLGLGLGNAPACRAALSVTDDGPGLVTRFEHGINSLLRLLDDVPFQLPPVPVVGGHTAPDAVRLATPSVQMPRPPIVIGGHGPRVLDIAARYADRWNVYSPPGADTDGVEVALERLIARFEDRCASAGRRAETIGRSILFDYAPGLQFASRGELAELVQVVSRIGFDECIVTAWPVPGDDGRAELLLEFIGDELPALKRA